MMLAEKTQNGFRNLQSLAWFTVAAGLALHLDAAAADPLAPKTFWFATGIAAVTACALARFWWGGKIAWQPGLASRLGLGLMLALTLSFATSDYRVTSEIGWNAWLLAGMLFFTCLDAFQFRQSRLRFLESAGLALGATAGWAVLQLLGMDPGPWGQRAMESFGGRPPAGLGNPNFMAGLALVTAPLAFARCSNWKPALVFLGLGWALAFLSGSKAAMVATGFQFFCLGHLAWHSDESEIWRKKALKIWGGLGLGSLLAGLAMAPALLRSRLWDLLTFSGESFVFRSQTWGSAWKMFLENPVLGSGPGTFFALYPSFRPVEALKGALQHSYEVTHPENWIAQLLSEGGLLALLTLLALLWVTLKPLWKAAHAFKSAGDDKLLAPGLVLALGGCLVMNLAALDLFLPSTAWFFVAALAMAAALFGPPARAIGIEPEPYASVLICSVLVFFVSFVGSQSAGRWVSSRHLEKAKAFSRAGRLVEAMPFYAKALELDPANVEAHYFRARAMLDGAGAPADLVAAREEFEITRSLASDYVLVHEGLARISKKEGNIEKAIASWHKQLQLDPWFLIGWKELATLYFEKGMYPESVKVLQQGLEKFEGEPGLMNNLAIVMVEMKDFQGALEILQSITRTNPDPGARYNLAAVYAMMGETKNALREAEAVLQADPGHGQAKKLISTLKKGF